MALHSNAHTTNCISGAQGDQVRIHRYRFGSEIQTRKTLKGPSRCNSASKDGVRLRHEVLVVPKKMRRGRVAHDRVGVPAQLLVVGQTAVSHVRDAKGRTSVARQTIRVDVEDLQAHR